ncbi:DUF3549 family protein [Microbulbifer sp. THAF38]|uniref:DUF3549 family protein n=1 Tax=Microbulbifer sp. THAF38 TaxID=2587856 RepID=UPI001267B443|nr:DUF3549 family protein [Microbulbifer sp. THAF38]QFT53846.1 hypothetical protein FIU95_04565 [Microbulbifer sp. THAF38]
MSESGTLSALIEEADFKLRWFDLGRRLQPVTKSTAEAFEAGQKAWPYPYLRQAWSGLLLQPAEGGEPAVWFLRFPLDEQGKLQLQARDGLLRALAQELEQAPASESAVQLDQLLQQSGLLFTPSNERQAAFHAYTAKLLKQTPSTHYAAVLDYFSDPQSSRWDNLGLQGIADLATRWEPQKELLLRQIPHIAAPVFINLCHCLENEAIDHQLVEVIAIRARESLNIDTQDTPDFTLIAAAVRGISNSPALGLRHSLLKELLEALQLQPSSSDIRSTSVPPISVKSVELLAAIGSRCPLDLEDQPLAQLWLNALAQSNNQSTFNLLLSDLMFLPQVRASLLSTLRDPARDETLAQAFGNFLHGPKPIH